MVHHLLGLWVFVAFCVFTHFLLVANIHKRANILYRIFIACTHVILPCALRCQQANSLALDVSKGWPSSVPHGNPMVLPGGWPNKCVIPHFICDSDTTNVDL